MYFKTVFFLTITGSLAYAAQQINTPDKLIIATDLDNVLLSRDKGGIFKKLFTQLSRFKKLYTARKQRTSLKGTRGKKYGEGFYIFLKEQNKPKLAQCIKDVCISKKIKKETLKIMRSLKKQGFSIFTATNIGTLFFAELQKKFPETFNAEFIQQGMTVDFSQDDVIEKPDSRYFEHLKQKLNPDNTKQILFIDDKIENVQAAQKAGLLAIQYKNHKQLKRTLHKYDICTCK